MDLGPIALSFGADTGLAERLRSNSDASGSGGDEERPPSIHSMTTAEWRALYEKDGTNDLWMEDEFNAGSRLVVGGALGHGGVGAWGWGKVCGYGTSGMHRRATRPSGEPSRHAVGWGATLVSVAKSDALLRLDAALCLYYWVAQRLR